MLICQNTCPRGRNRGDAVGEEGRGGIKSEGVNETVVEENATPCKFQANFYS